MTKVIGFCRFSYPALGGFQVEHSTVQDREDFLYAPRRLDDRFRHFEQITLPALKRQTDPDFTLLILIGESLPEAARARLDAAVAALPQAMIVSRPPLPHRKVCQDVINAVRGPLVQPCLQFRMDDDDAVAVDFVAELRRAARDIDPLLRFNGTAAIDFCSGLEVMVGPEGLLAGEVVSAYATAGLGFYADADRPLTVMNFNHSKMARFMPTVTLSHKPMFVRSLNDFNDSRMGRKQKPHKLAPVTDDLRALLKDRFAIDVADIDRSFQTR